MKHSQFRGVPLLPYADAPLSLPTSRNDGGHVSFDDAFRKVLALVEDGPRTRASGLEIKDDQSEKLMPEGAGE